MTNFGYVAILVYIAITAIMLLIPRKKLEVMLKIDTGITETSWKRLDTKLVYARIIILIAATLTVLLMALPYALINLFA